MIAAETRYTVEDFFQRSLTAHLPPPRFRKLQETTILVAGVGGGSNIAELLARKGIGRMIIADLDVFEPHNIRQRCSLVSTLGVEKVTATEQRLRDVHPYLQITPIREGITLDNVEALVRKSDVVIDMLDLHAINEKVALHRAARRQGKWIFTAPSVINGAVLWVFAPDGMTFEEWSGWREGEPLADLAWRLLKRAIPRFPEEAPASMYEGAARGERTLPLDGVGVEQAAVMTVGAVENLLLGRMDRIVVVPKGIQADLSNPARMAEIVTVRMEEEPSHAETCA